ncbi:MAG: dienelactone hydrolase family protein [Pirellulales bacterium]
MQSRRHFLGSASAAYLSLAGLRRAHGFVAGGRHVEWLAEVQRAPEKLPADAPTLASLLEVQGKPIDTRAAWSRRAAELRAWWREFLGPLPKRDEKKPPATRVIATDRVGEVVRELVEYEVEPGEKTEAYLLRPSKAGGRRPGVVVLHSTVDQSIRQPAGVEVSRGAEKAFGLSLAERGYVTICPRNFLWPETNRIGGQGQVKKLHERHPKLRGMGKMLFDAQVALGILAARDDVDARQLGAVGHSLGGKEVLYLAAFDERVKVAVSSEGGIGTKFSNWDAPWYLGEVIRDKSFVHEHHELLALVAPRAFLLVGGDSADGARSWPFIAAALPVYELFEKPARLGLFNHRQGHSVPPAAERRIAEWIETYRQAGSE